MARSRSTTAAKQPVELNKAQVEAAIPKLTRRLDELKALTFDSWSDEFERRVEGLHRKLDDTIVSVFGHETLDYDRYKSNRPSYPLNMNYETPDHEKLEGFQRDVGNMISRTGTALEMLEERLEEFGGGTPAVRAVGSLTGFDLHPAIEKATVQRFKDGHYADAVEAASKTLIKLVQLASESDLDGADLMRTVFSVNKPVLCFTATCPPTNKTDKSEQEGMMHLYEGAVMALRNPRAHRLIDDDPEDAAHLIALINTLAKLLDKAKPT